MVGHTGVDGSAHQGGQYQLRQRVDRDQQQTEQEDRAQRAQQTTERERRIGCTGGVRAIGSDSSKRVSGVERPS